MSCIYPSISTYLESRQSVLEKITAINLLIDSMIISMADHASGAGSTISEYDSKENKLRADLRAIEYQLESLKSTAKATKSGKLPKITLNDTYTHNELEYNDSSYATDDYNRNIASINLSFFLIIQRYLIFVSSS